MKQDLKNYWVLNKKSDTYAVFICVVEDRVKELFIEWFELEVEFMQAESKYIDGRFLYRIIINEAEKIRRLNGFCIATETGLNLS